MAGKSASAIIDYITTCDVFDPEYCKSILKKKAKLKTDDVIRDILGYSLNAAVSTKIDICTKHQSDLSNHIKAIDDKIGEIAKPY